MRKKYVIYFSTLLISLALILLISAGLYLNFDVKELRATFAKRYSQVVLDDKDNILGVYLNADEQWHLQSRTPIPEKLQIAVLNYEDRNFYQHLGVDPKGILRAIRDNLFKAKRSGGSTISMQVAKLFAPKTRTLANKYQEIIHALKIERNFTKDEILAMYLNNAPYGGNIVGYETASLLYFQKYPQELTWAEACLLAVLPNSPGLMHIEKNRSQLMRKRNFLLQTLFTRGVISKFQLELSLKEPIPRRRYSFRASAPHLSRRLTSNSSEKVFKKRFIFWWAFFFVIFAKLKI